MYLITGLIYNGEICAGDLSVQPQIFGSMTDEAELKTVTWKTTLTTLRTTQATIILLTTYFPPSMWFYSDQRVHPLCEKGIPVPNYSRNLWYEHKNCVNNCCFGKVGFVHLLVVTIKWNYLALLCYVIYSWAFSILLLICSLWCNNFFAVSF